MPFEPTVFVNNAPPGITASQLNKLGSQYEEVMGDLPGRISNPETGIYGAITQLIDESVPSESLQIVNHGDDANYPRPDHPGPVLWVGTVPPLNKLPNDFYFASSSVPISSTPGWSDNFNRGDAATLGVTPGGLKVWNVAAGSGTPTWSIVGNQASLTATGSGNAIAYANALVSDGELRGTIANVGTSPAAGNFGFSARVGGPGDYLFLERAAGGDLRYNLKKRVAGTASPIAYSASGVTMGNGDVIRWIFDGTSMNILRGDTSIITASGVTDFEFNTGFGMYGGSNTLNGKMDNMSFIPA